MAGRAQSLGAALELFAQDFARSLIWSKVRARAGGSSETAAWPGNASSPSRSQKAANAVQVKVQKIRGHSVSLCGARPAVSPGRPTEPGQACAAPTAAHQRA